MTNQITPKVKKLKKTFGNATSGIKANETVAEFVAHLSLCLPSVFDCKFYSLLYPRCVCGEIKE